MTVTWRESARRQEGWGRRRKGATDVRMFCSFAASLDFLPPFPSFQFQGRSPSGRAGGEKATSRGRESFGVGIWRKEPRIRFFAFACLPRLLCKVVSW